MNEFFVVVGEAQTDGLSRLVRYSTHEAALIEARRMASKVPDTCFYVCRAEMVAVSPAPKVEIYDLRTSVREYA